MAALFDEHVKQTDNGPYPATTLFDAVNVNGFGVPGSSSESHDKSVGFVNYAARPVPPHVSAKSHVNVQPLMFVKVKNSDKTNAKPVPLSTYG